MLLPADVMGGGHASGSWTLPGDIESIPKARHAMVELARRFRCDPDNVAVAVTEAVSNAILHGYRDGTTGQIHLVGTNEGSELVVTVADDGVGMSPNPASEGLHMGMVLIAATTSSVDYATTGPGVRVTMRFPCHG